MKNHTNKGVHFSDSIRDQTICLFQKFHFCPGSGPRKINSGNQRFSLGPKAWGYLSAQLHYLTHLGRLVHPLLHAFWLISIFNFLIFNRLLVFSLQVQLHWSPFGEKMGFLSHFFRGLEGGKDKQRHPDNEVVLGKRRKSLEDCFFLRL